MGIDVDGGMIVGCSVDEISEDIVPESYTEDLHEYLVEELRMNWFSPYYDSDISDWVVGYTVPDVLIGGDDWEDWMMRIEELAYKFKSVTKVDAKLIGMQDVT